MLSKINTATTTTPTPRTRSNRTKVVLEVPGTEVRKPGRSGLDCSTRAHSSPAGRWRVSLGRSLARSLGRSLGRSLAVPQATPDKNSDQPRSGNLNAPLPHTAKTAQVNTSGGGSRVTQQAADTDHLPAPLVEKTSLKIPSKPTEGEVPPAGCAGVVCANETNKKKTKWRAFSLLRIAEGRARRGGRGRGNIQHAARTQQPQN